MLKRETMHCLTGMSQIFADGVVGIGELNRVTISPRKTRMYTERAAEQSDYDPNLQSACEICNE
jgi:hypothetical protein